MKQTSLLPKKSHRFGGNQRTTRASRTYRPISVRQSMHLILKSKNAIKDWSFLKPKNKNEITKLIKKYANQHKVRVFSHANVGNHLHLHIKVASHNGYKAFIRALTGAITLRITGANKFNKLKNKFWTQTPYTRYVFGVTDHLKLTDYIHINQIEGFGYSRCHAEMVVKNWDELYTPE